MRKKIESIYMFVILTTLIFSSTIAHSAVVISDVLPVNVTPSGFSVIWQTDGYATPDISVYADPDGLQEITNQLEVTMFPVYGGNPEITDDYTQENFKDDISIGAMTLGNMMIRVDGCSPQTAYYYRLSSTDINGVTTSWPIVTLYSVTTTNENSFLVDSKQIILNIDNQNNTLNPFGWIVTALSNNALFGVSSFVGDGAGSTQALIDLNNLWGLDGYTWQPALLENITIEVRNGSTKEYMSLDVDFSNLFSVSEVVSIDLITDQDNDSIPDFWEISKFGDLTVADSTTDYDNDNLLDIDEYHYGTDPKLSDTDLDNMLDGWEVSNNLDPLDNGNVNPNEGPNGDPDNDTYTNIDEYYAGSNANDFESKPVNIDIKLVKGMNLYFHPITTTSEINSYDLITLLGDNIDIAKILVYDSITGNYNETHYNANIPTGDNFNIRSSDGIIVYSNLNKVISYNPQSNPFKSYNKCNSIDLTSGLNLTGFHCIPTGYSAYHLLADIGNELTVSSVQRFNSETGKYETAGYFNGQTVGVDFSIKPGEAYYIFMILDISGFRPQT